MMFNIKTKVSNKEEARTLAIEFQKWQSNKSLSNSEALIYYNFFFRIGKHYGLIREFKENGII